MKQLQKVEQISPREIERLFVRNKSRVGIGIGHNTSMKLRFSMIVNWQYSRTGIEDNFNVSDIAYQLKVRFFWKNKLINKEKYDTINR